MNSQIKNRNNMNNNRFHIYFYKIIILAVILNYYFTLLHPANIPNIRFEHFDYDDGLSHPFVLAILQDDQGFMWFGKFDGLNKYNGYDFDIYRYDDKYPDGLPQISGHSFVRILWVRR